MHIQEFQINYLLLQYLKNLKHCIMVKYNLICNLDETKMLMKFLCKIELSLSLYQI